MHRNHVGESLLCQAALLAEQDQTLVEIDLWRECIEQVPRASLGRGSVLLESGGMGPSAGLERAIRQSAPPYVERYARQPARESVNVIR